MKIEIAESMVYSWLRKVRNCQIVQTNWKPAPELNDRTFRDMDTKLQAQCSNALKRYCEFMASL